MSGIAVMKTLQLLPLSLRLTSINKLLSVLNINIKNKIMGFKYLNWNCLRNIIETDKKYFINYPISWK